MAVMCGGLPTDAPCYSPGAVSPSLTVNVTDSSSRYSLRRGPAIQGSVGPQMAMAGWLKKSCRPSEAVKAV